MFIVTEYEALILVRFVWGLKQIPPKIESKVSILGLSDKDLVRKLLTSNRIFR